LKANPKIPEPEDKDYFLTARRKDGTIAKKVYHTQTMPEYPETSKGGIAYCVNVSHLEPKQAEELHSNVSNTTFTRRLLIIS
jgi:hypothetical protein